MSIELLEPKIKKKTKTSVLFKVEEEAQVIVHCTFRSSFPTQIRIWKTTFLIGENPTSKIKLLHAEGIAFYPQWKEINAKRNYSFTLYFGALPKSCQTFDLLEKIPEPGGFFVPSIKRNKTDVYQIDLD